MIFIKKNKASNRLFFFRENQSSKKPEMFVCIFKLFFFFPVDILNVFSAGYLCREVNVTRTQSERYVMHKNS